MVNINENVKLDENLILLQLSTIGGSKAYTREITGIGQNSCIKTMGVKVVKASNLGSKGSEKKCYVVVELDEPSQRCQTKSVAGPGSVYTWEQNFSVYVFKIINFNMKNLFIF